MFDPRDYWEQCFDGLDPDTFDFSTAKPSRILVDFCEKYGNDRGSFLDLGCGNGNNAHYLAQLGYDVFGIDISKAAVLFCRGRFARFGLSGTFLQARFDSMPCADGRFASLLCLAGLDHVTREAASASIAEMKRVVSDAGLILLTFAPEDADENILNEAEKLPDGTLKFVSGVQSGMLFRQYRDEEIREMLRDLEIRSYDYTELGTRVIVCSRGLPVRRGVTWTE